MSDVYVSDVDWALRAYLRTALPTIKVWLAQPKGSPTFPMIVITGRVGGSPDLNIPLDHPRASFDCWGAPGGNGRQGAVDAMRALVSALTAIENMALDEATFGLGAYDITARWAPDISDLDNVLPRYVVDASIELRSL